jgi:TolB protein
MGPRANLTHHPAVYTAPAWSPDGLAFTSRRDGNSEIYVIGADGADPVNLT